MAVKHIQAERKTRPYTTLKASPALTNNSLIFINWRLNVCHRSFNFLPLKLDFSVKSCQVTHGLLGNPFKFLLLLFTYMEMQCRARLSPRSAMFSQHCIPPTRDPFLEIF